MTKTERATTFLKMASSGNVEEAYEQFVHENFIHHNAYFKGDRQTLLEGMKESAKQFQNKNRETLRTLEDGDLVAVHSRVILDNRRMGVIHIFRFEGDMIVELWEAGQEDSKESPNENGIF